MLIGFQEFLDTTDTIFNLMSVVDMQVTRELAGTLIYLNHCLEKFFDSCPVLKRGRNHGNTKQGAECVDVDVISATLKLIIHVQGTHHTDIHIHQLRSQI